MSRPAPRPDPNYRPTIPRVVQEEVPIIGARPPAPPEAGLLEQAARDSQIEASDASQRLARREAEARHYATYRLDVALYLTFDVKPRRKRLPESDAEGRACRTEDGCTFVALDPHARRLAVLVRGAGAVEIALDTLTEISLHADLPTREAVLRRNRAALARALRAEPTP